MTHVHGPDSPPLVDCAPTLELRALPGIPVIGPGDELADLVSASLDRSGLELRDSDVLVVASKLISRSEDRFVDVSRIQPSPRAIELASRVAKDPRVVELILQESSVVSRAAPGVLIVRHRLGFVSANAGIDASNARPPAPPPHSGPWALLLPKDPDASAERLRAALIERSGVRPGVVISDSFGRPFRFGTVGAAIGVAGLPALFDQRGRVDLFGRILEHTCTALADQVAAAADLVAGQAAEGRGVVLVRGLTYPEGNHSATELVRPIDQDLYL